LVIVETIHRVPSASATKIAEDDINEWLDRTFFEGGTEPEACAAQWGAGERMDWQMAVSALF
jgi:hypothetical protein